MRTSSTMAYDDGDEGGGCNGDDGDDEDDGGTDNDNSENECPRKGKPSTFRSKKCIIKF